MSTPATASPIPPALLIGAGVLVFLSLALAGFSRLTGYNATPMPVSRVVESYDLRFEDRPDGGVMIYRAQDNRLVDTLQPGTNGFVRGVLRGLVRERHADHIGSQPPFRLTRWADGRLSLQDPSTDRLINLEVFGPTNAGAFADILIASSRVKDTP